VAIMTGMAGADANLAAFGAQRFGWRYGEGRRLLAFTLQGTAALPPRTSRAITAPAPPDLKPTGDALLDRGSLLYHSYCVECHGVAAVGNGSFPDLRRTQMLGNLQALLLEGALVLRGMPTFKGRLQQADVAAIGAYLRSQHLAEDPGGHR
jgi:quinohemoprotein ethanol dehydrogenase